MLNNFELINMCSKKISGYFLCTFKYKCTVRPHNSYFCSGSRKP